MKRRKNPTKETMNVYKSNKNRINHKKYQKYYLKNVLIHENLHEMLIMIIIPELKESVETRII